MSLSDNRRRKDPVHKRRRKSAHHHARQHCAQKGQQQQRIDDQLKDPQRTVLALEDHGIIFPVQYLMYDRQREHRDTQPLMRELLSHLKRHQE